jgi:hypothetical protein
MNMRSDRPGYVLSPSSGVPGAGIHPSCVVYLGYNHTSSLPGIADPNAQCVSFRGRRDSWVPKESELDQAKERLVE